MRQVGTIISEGDAQRFSDYLLTQGVSARVDKAASGHSIWVYEENDIDRAKAALDEFNRDPQQPKFVEAEQAAGKIRQEKIDSRRKAKSNVIELRDRWQTPPSRRAPLTMLLIAVSVAITVLSDFGKDSTITDWIHLSNVGPNLPEVRQGELWRLFTPMFLHLGVMHLVFDMYWLYVLGTKIEIHRGPLVLAALVLTSQLVSALAQNYEKGPLFGGMSGVVYALLGYGWMKTRFEPTSGIFIDQQTVMLMLVWLVLCQAGFVKDVANASHFAGLAMGLVAGYVPTLLKR